MLLNSEPSRLDSEMLHCKMCDENNVIGVERDDCNKMKSFDCLLLMVHFIQQEEQLWRSQYSACHVMFSVCKGIGEGSRWTDADRLMLSKADR